MKLPANITILALLGQANAWWGNGHLLVARVAYELSDQTVIDQVDAILNVLKVSDPSWTVAEGQYPMVECVTFADDIKYKGGSYQSNWHFIDTPYLDMGGDISDYPQFIADTHNVTEAISAITSWINMENDYMSTYEYQQIMKAGVKGHSEADGLSTAMRLLLHYAGDVHQPLHGAARVDSNYPAGDRGGNDFVIPAVGGAKNLHSAWDSVLFSEATDYKLPLSDSDWNELSAEAKRLIAQYPLSPSVANDIDPNHWADDSYEIASSFLYNNIVEGEDLPQDYINQGKILAEEQIVKGGARLAATLKSLKLDKWTGLSLIHI